MSDHDQLRQALIEAFRASDLAGGGIGYPTLADVALPVVDAHVQAERAVIEQQIAEHVTLRLQRLALDVGLPVHLDITTLHEAGDTPAGTNPEVHEIPEVVCLCGSTRFYDAFQQANFDLTMQGKIVLSVGFYPHAKAEHGHGEGIGHSSVEKVALDELHKRKIDLADRVLVLNVGGYIGESTRSEIEYAHQRGRRVDYLEAP